MARTIPLFVFWFWNTFGPDVPIQLDPAWTIITTPTTVDGRPDYATYQEHILD